jgi:hypothetical protein
MRWQDLQWGNVVHMRFWFGAVIAYVIGAIPGVLVGVDALAVVGGIALALLSMYLNLQRGQVYQCPHCRKRVKLGATHCHHCGLPV